MAVRWVVAGVGWLVWSAWWADPVRTLEVGARVVAVGGWLAGAGWGWWAASRVMSARHRAEQETPVAKALARILEIPEGTNPKWWLTIPEDAAGEPAIRLPTGYVPNKLVDEQVVTAVSTILGLQDPLPEWRLRGNAPLLIMRRRVYPPDKVDLLDPAMLEAMEAAPEHAPVIGLTHAYRPVPLELEHDSPHVLIAGGTGAGKSVVGAVALAQGLRNGWAVSVADRKLVSHKWLSGIPGVDYWRSFAAIHEGLVALHAELLRRMAIVEEWDDDDSEPDFVRHVLVIEETNSTIRKLRDWWSEVRNSTDPQRSPAIAALEELSFMGRQMMMHVMYMAQSGTANALGGGEMRENCGIKLMARYSWQQWRMLVGSDIQMPRSTNHPGRWQLVTGGSATPVQVAWPGSVSRRHGLARDLALAGVRPVTEGPSPAVQAWLAGELTPPAALAADQDGLRSASRYQPASQGRPQLRAVDSPPDDSGRDELVTLRQAWEDGTVTAPSVGAVRQARQRDPEFPKPAGKRGTEFIYRPDDLARWSDNRESTARQEAAR